MADALLPLRLLPARDRPGYLARLLFWPTLAERRLVALPGALASLYPLIRLARLGARPLASRSSPGTT
jgi:hypothetical protein